MKQQANKQAKKEPGDTTESDKKKAARTSASIQERNEIQKNQDATFDPLVQQPAISSEARSGSSFSTATTPYDPRIIEQNLRHLFARNSLVEKGVNRKEAFETFRALNIIAEQQIAQVAMQQQQAAEVASRRKHEIQRFQGMVLPTTGMNQCSSVSVNTTELGGTMLLSALRAGAASAPAPCPAQQQAPPSQANCYNSTTSMVMDRLGNTSSPKAHNETISNGTMTRKRGSESSRKNSDGDAEKIRRGLLEQDVSSIYEVSRQIQDLHEFENTVASDTELEAFWTNLLDS